MVHSTENTLRNRVAQLGLPRVAACFRTLLLYFVLFALGLPGRCKKNAEQHCAPAAGTEKFAAWNAPALDFA